MIRFPASSIAVGLILGLPLSTAVPGSAQTPDSDRLGPQAVAQISALMAEKAQRTDTEKKVASALLLELKQRQEDGFWQQWPPLSLASGVRDNGRVTVDLDGKITDSLLLRVAELGGTVVNAHPKFQAARVDLPLSEVVRLASFSEVRGVRPADIAISQVTTQGDTAHGTDIVRPDFGVDGTGVQVAAMSDSVEALGDLQAAGELPPGVTVLAGQGGTGASEGTALLEIIHDMAPGSDLFFATGQGGQAQMAQNILDLQQAGCDVIVDDLLYLTEPVFQDGVIAEAVNAVHAAGTVYYSSAGNSGNLDSGTSGVFEGIYEGTTLPAPLANAAMSAHNFGGGTNATNITFDPPFLITLQWANPQDAATDDYDLYVLNADLSQVIAASTNTQNGTQDPVEAITSEARDDLNNKIVVTKFSGNDVFIHLNTHRGMIEHGTDGQIFGHPAAEGAVTVAAVNVATAAGGQFTGGAANPSETFTSDGPRRIFFNADGSPVVPNPLTGSPALGETPSVVRQKPDIAAADGVSTATPGFNPFFGTSASAPHSAAISALYRELFPSVDPANLTELFNSTALDIDDLGFDRNSGNGIMMPDSAFENTIFSDGFESGDASAWTAD